MHDQIGIAANWTGKVRVVGLGQTVMSKRLWQVARAFQALEQTNFQGLLLRLPAKRREQALQFYAMR